MAMKAAAHHLLAKSTGDNTQRETDRLIVVENQGPNEQIFRGVVLDVGVHVVAPIEVGNVIHYTSAYSLHENHVVPEQYVIAYEDEG